MMGALIDGLYLRAALSRETDAVIARDTALRALDQLIGGHT